VTTDARLQVEIWSDVVCPFCYMGKRRLEGALAQMTDPGGVEITWRSFQLQPEARTDPTRSAVERLAAQKGWTMDFTRAAMADVATRARPLGLELQLEKAVVANTFDAHRLAHFAASLGEGDAMQERLFRAYFVDGLNVGDEATLIALATDVGLRPDEARRVLADGGYALEVRRDIVEAARLGIQGVPFFVFNRRYAVSGAQDTAVFLAALQRSLEGRSDEAGAVCTTHGRCD